MGVSNRLVAVGGSYAVVMPPSIGSSAPVM
jgi:hypothetical protein